MLSTTSIRGSDPCCLDPMGRRPDGRTFNVGIRAEVQAVLTPTLRNQPSGAAPLGFGSRHAAARRAGTGDGETKRQVRPGVVPLDRHSALPDFLGRMKLAKTPAANTACARPRFPETRCPTRPTTGPSVMRHRPDARGKNTDLPRLINRRARIAAVHSVLS